MKMVTFENISQWDLNAASYIRILFMHILKVLIVVYQFTRGYHTKTDCLHPLVLLGSE